MALRRPHRKSRHGCVECKRRRVKCDETRPTCSNCSKRLTECEYDSSTSLLWTNEEPRRTRSTKSGSEGPQQPGPEPSNYSPAQSFGLLGRLGGLDADASSPSAPHSTSLNLNDLELMMQWCNSTHKFFSRNARTDPVWRYRVPEEALNHPFLMHGILALSSLHIARTRSDDARRPGYVSAAVAHQNQALAFFRELLSDINEVNAKAMFAFASIVVVYAFGFPHSSPDAQDPGSCVDDLLQVLMLSRGVQQVLNQATPWIRRSDWEELFHLDGYDTRLPEPAQLAMQRLQEVNIACGMQDAAHDVETYENVIENLADMMAGVYGGLTSVSVACRWAIKLRPAFVEQVRFHHPLALTVLVHYCAVLNRLRDDWCIDQWTGRVPQAVWQILDERWRVYIRGPMVEIFGEGGFNDS